MEAANEDEMVERAKAITRGSDPILLRKPVASYPGSGGTSDAAG